MSSKYEIVRPTIGKTAPLKELFIFESENIAYLVGKQPYIAGTSTYNRTMLLPCIFVGLLLLLAVIQSSIRLESLLGALFFLVLGMGLCWFPYRNRLLSLEGKVIQGRIIETQENYKKVEHHGIPFIPISFVRYGWEINALCAFRTPEGKVISSRRRAIRNDLVEKITIDGTPIIVIYRNEHHYKIL